MLQNVVPRPHQGVHVVALRLALGRVRLLLEPRVLHRQGERSLGWDGPRLDGVDLGRINPRVPIRDGSRDLHVVLKERHVLGGLDGSRRSGAHDAVLARVRVLQGAIARAHEDFGSRAVQVPVEVHPLDRDQRPAGEGSRRRRDASDSGQSPVVRNARCCCRGTPNGCRDDEGEEEKKDLHLAGSDIADDRAAHRSRRPGDGRRRPHRPARDRDRATEAKVLVLLRPRSRVQTLRIKFLSCRSFVHPVTDSLCLSLIRGGIRDSRRARGKLAMREGSSKAKRLAHLDALHEKRAKKRTKVETKRGPRFSGSGNKKKARAAGRSSGDALSSCSRHVLDSLGVAPSTSGRAGGTSPDIGIEGLVEPMLETNPKYSRRVGNDPRRSNWMAKLADKTLVLDNPASEVTLSKAQKQALKHALSNCTAVRESPRERNRFFSKHLEDLRKSECVFEDFFDLHAMWLDYASRWHERQQQNHSQKPDLSSLDLTGGFVRVVSSSQPNYAGAEGIVLTTSGHAITLIEKSGNRIRTIPAKGCAFRVEARTFSLLVHGDQAVKRGALG